MGSTHALSGAAAFGVAAVPAMPLVDLSVGEIALGTVVCAGAAMLPDIDHPSSHVSRAFGSLSRAFAWVIAWAAGGHRKGVHSLLGVAVISALVFLGLALQAGALAWALTGLVLSAVLAGAGFLLGLASPCDRGRRAYRSRGHGVAVAWACAASVVAVTAGAVFYPVATGTGMVAVLMVLCLASAARVFKIRRFTRLRSEVDDALPVPVTFVLLAGGADLRVVPFAVVLGVLVHIAGDMVTVGGCPLGWPWSLAVRGPRMFRTDSLVERGPVVWACVVVFVATVCWNSGLVAAFAAAR